MPPRKNLWVLKATVHKSAKCRGFVGYGDVHPGNVSPLILHDAEMSMAKTRAVNRALRKAYGIALCPLEGLPPKPLPPEQTPVLRHTLQCRPPFQKGVLYAARTNPVRSRQLRGALAGLDRKILQEIQFCDVLHKYRTGMRRGTWRRTQLGGWAGNEGARARHGGPVGCATGLHTSRRRVRKRS